MDNSKSTVPHRSNKPQLVYSTTDGRQRFPDILQVTYGDKAVIGFDRYGRAIGAVVPVEAVRMLAGKAEFVDDDVRQRIQRAANALLEQLPGENGNQPDDVELTTIEEVEAARRLRTAPSKPAKKSRSPSAG